MSWLSWTCPTLAPFIFTAIWKLAHCNLHSTEADVEFEPRAQSLTTSKEAWIERTLDHHQHCWQTQPCSSLRLCGGKCLSHPAEEDGWGVGQQTMEHRCFSLGDRYSVCLFLMWTIFNIFIEFATTLLQFWFWFFDSEACGILALQLGI